MAMSKKDYELVAEALRETHTRVAEVLRPANAEVGHVVLDVLTNRLVRDFSIDNPRFSKVKFLRASGYRGG